MVLVAVTGPVGSGKTTLLSSFAECVVADALEVDGFISVAEDRPDPSRGATAYRLHWLADGSIHLFASRDASGTFVIEPQAVDALEAWAHRIPAKQDVIVLDEFGLWEAKGQGLVRYWSAIVRSQPRMIVVSLRQGVQRDVESHIGREFDQVFEANDASTLERLLSMVAELKDWETIGAFGAASGAIECSLGSALHGGRFPFTGTIMGALQAATLGLAAGHLGKKEWVIWVSTISAGLKAIGPGAAKLTPMIAIVVQGFLFTLGSAIGKWTRWGQSLGAFLVGCWAALQGFLLQYLMLGHELSRAWDRGAVFLQTQFGLHAPGIGVFVAAIVMVNGVLCVGLSNVISSRFIKSGIDSKVSGLTRPTMARVFFWIPFVLVVALAIFDRTGSAKWLWIVLRAGAVLVSLFGLGLLVRNLDFGRWLRKRGYWGPALAVERAREEPGKS